MGQPLPLKEREQIKHGPAPHIVKHIIGGAAPGDAVPAKVEVFAEAVVGGASDGVRFLQNLAYLLQDFLAKRRQAQFHG
jgi:hypothetical protein